jgi:hypothetical protein
VIVEKSKQQFEITHPRCSAQCKVHSAQCTVHSARAQQRHLQCRVGFQRFPQHPSALNANVVAPKNQLSQRRVRPQAVSKSADTKRTHSVVSQVEVQQCAVDLEGFGKVAGALRTDVVTPQVQTLE